MLKSEFEKFILFLRNKKILIITHDLVDIDGLISCYALKNFINLFLKNQQVVVYFSEITKLTTSFLKQITETPSDVDFDFSTKIDLSKFDICLVLDTNNLEQINNKDELLNSEIPFLFIDHHYEQKKNVNENISSMNLIDEKYSSTTEIILDLFDIFKVELSTSLKMLMIAAILTDSGFFKYGDNHTIQNVSKLLNGNVKFQDILALLEHNIDISEKIAKIKGLQRVELNREGDYLIGITHVSSYGAAVSSTLLKVGFDISIVYSKEKDFHRIITRAKKDVCLKTGVHLGKILGELADIYEGSGGGHDGAASLTSDVELNIIIDKIVEKVKQYLLSET